MKTMLKKWLQYLALLLTALATLVLAVAIMTARSEVSTGTATIASPCCK